MSQRSSYKEAGKLRWEVPRKWEGEVERKKSRDNECRDNSFKELCREEERKMVVLGEIH